MTDTCPPLPPTRMRHRGDKIDPRGRVSALCFPKPRAIDMKRATWVMTDDAVTCPKCRALIAERSKPPNVGVEPPQVGSNEGLGVVAQRSKRWYWY